MKNGDKLEALLIDRLDRIESKLDNIFETVIPQLKVDIALAKKDANYFAGITTAVGGAIATIVSLTIAKMSK